MAWRGSTEVPQTWSHSPVCALNKLLLPTSGPWYLNWEITTAPPCKTASQKGAPGRGFTLPNVTNQGARGGKLGQILCQWQISESHQGNRGKDPLFRSTWPHSGHGRPHFPFSPACKTHRSPSPSHLIGPLFKEGRHEDASLVRAGEPGDGESSRAARILPRPGEATSRSSGQGLEAMTGCLVDSCRTFIGKWKASQLFDSRHLPSF